MSKVDSLGITLSSICAVHCVTVPFIFPALSLAATYGVLVEGLEVFMTSSAVLLGGFAVLTGVTAHKKSLPVLFWLISSVLLTVGSLSHDIPFVHHALTCLGGVVMVISHLINVSSHRSCETHCCISGEEG